WRNHEMKPDHKARSVLKQMKVNGTYAGNYYNVHSCVADFLKDNKDEFTTKHGVTSAFLTITKYLNNFCMDKNDVIHANDCPRMNDEEKCPVVINPVSPTLVEIEWIEDEVANELNSDPDDGGNAHGDEG
ncbi:MAG: hypothetical protein BV459_08840, partial [Thermoplasmata archaeon M11B2D]